MTTTLEWNVYDGTKETLPEAYADVLLVRARPFGKQTMHGVAFRPVDDIDKGLFGWYITTVGGIRVYHKMEVGDMWAWWPKATDIQRHD